MLILFTLLSCSALSQQGIYEEIEGKGAALFHHIQDFAWLYDHLADYRSKKTLYAILNNWYRYDFITTAQTKESLFDDYFDLDLVTCTPEEVFVDLGAYTGDTVLSYLKNYGEDCYQRIYCYEITPETFQILQETLAPYRDIVCRQKGGGDAEGTLSLVNHQTSASSNTLGHESRRTLRALSKRPCKGPKTTSCGTIPNFSSRCTTTTRTFGRSPA